MKKIDFIELIKQQKDTIFRGAMVIKDCGWREDKEFEEVNYNGEDKI